MELWPYLYLVGAHLVVWNSHKFIEQKHHPNAVTWILLTKIAWQNFGIVPPNKKTATLASECGSLQSCSLRWKLKNQALEKVRTWKPSFSRFHITFPEFTCQNTSFGHFFGTPGTYSHGQIRDLCIKFPGRLGFLWGGAKKHTISCLTSGIQGCLLWWISSGWWMEVGYG